MTDDALKEAEREQETLVGKKPRPKPKKKKPKDPHGVLGTPAPLATILQQRGKSYGPYIENARMAQAIKRELRSDSGCFAVMQPDEQQSLDMIATKIARIVTGPNGQLDSWRDIEGYSRLIRERMEREAADAKLSAKR